LKRIALSLASGLLIGVDLVLGRARAVVLEGQIALSKTSNLLTATLSMLAADLGLSGRTAHENVNGIVGFIDILEAVLEVLKVDLADLRDLGAPFGGDPASISEDAFATLGFLLQNHVLKFSITRRTRRLGSARRGRGRRGREVSWNGWETTATTTTASPSLCCASHG
jgi:hypothetical protein